MYDTHAKAGRRLAESGIDRLTKEKEEEIDISAAEARQRIVQGFELEAEARGITIDKEEVDITGKLNVIFTDDMKDA